MAFSKPSLFWQHFELGSWIPCQLTHFGTWRCTDPKKVTVINGLKYAAFLIFKLCAYCGQNIRRMKKTSSSIVGFQACQWTKSYNGLWIMLCFIMKAHNRFDRKTFSVFWFCSFVCINLKVSVLDFHRRMFDHSLYNYRHYVVFIIMIYSLFNFLTSIFPTGLFDYQLVYIDPCAATKTEIMVIRIKKMNTKMCYTQFLILRNTNFCKRQRFISHCSSLMKISIVLLSAVKQMKRNEIWFQ